LGVRIPRFLAVSLAAAFFLTLLFATVIGAQEKGADTEGAQAVEVQQQVLTSQQGLIFAEGKQTDGVQVAATGSGALRGTEVETRTTDNDRRVDLIRIPFPNDCKMTKSKVSFVLQDDDGTQADFIEGNNVKVVRDGDVLKLTSTAPDPDGNDKPDIAPLNERGGDKRLDTGGLTVATSTGIECQNEPANDGGGGGGGGGGNGGSGGGGDGSGTVGTSQTENTTGTDTTNANTASPAAEVTTADANLNANTNRPNSGSFRCEFFLRTVTDDLGALRDQYRGNEQIVQRFEQCLSENVLADTIPNRNLPFTGGMSLLLIAAIGLAAIVAGGTVLRAVMRRGR
jgi:hypothetical protein